MMITLVLFPSMITSLIGYFLYNYSKSLSISAMILIPVIFMYSLGSYNVLFSIPLSIIIVLTVHGHKKSKVS